MKPKGVGSVEQVGLVMKGGASDGVPGDQPMQGDEGVVAGHSGGIGACPHGDSPVEQSTDGRGVRGSGDAVATDEVFALVGHAGLDGDSAAEGGHPVDVVGGDGLGVVEPPPHTAPVGS
jgi:hypothetical protein